MGKRIIRSEDEARQCIEAAQRAGQMLAAWARVRGGLLCSLAAKPALHRGEQGPEVGHCSQERDPAGAAHGVGGAAS